MKKRILIIIFSCLLLVIVSLFTFSYLEKKKLNDDITELNNKLKNIKNNYETIEVSNSNYENEIAKLEEEVNDKIEEKEIWKKAKEKLTEALS